MTKQDTKRSRTRDADRAVLVAARVLTHAAASVPRLARDEIEPHSMRKEFAAVSVTPFEIKDICSEISLTLFNFNASNLVRSHISRFANNFCLLTWLLWILDKLRTRHVIECAAPHLASRDGTN